MHARTPLRRGLWYVGAVACTAAAFAISVWLGVVVGIAALLIIFGSTLLPRSDFYLRSIRRGDHSLRAVALTFDDGPDPTRTPQILQVLSDAGAAATFFMIGRRVTEHRSLVRRVLAAGHEIGNHSHTHERTLPFRWVQRQRREIEATTQALLDAGVSEVRWFRPPMGIATPALSRALSTMALRSVTWAVRSRDLGDPDEDRIVDRVLRQVRSGDIVLMHDGSDRHGSGPAPLPGALRRILEGLRERGLEPVTVSTLLGAAETVR